MGETPDPSLQRRPNKRTRGDGSPAPLEVGTNDFEAGSGLTPPISEERLANLAKLRTAAHAKLVESANGEGVEKP